MTNTMRISADYRANGFERAAIGYAPNGTATPWTVEVGTCAIAYTSSTFRATETHRFATDAQADAFVRENGYR